MGVLKPPLPLLKPNATTPPVSLLCCILSTCSIKSVRTLLFLFSIDSNTNPSNFKTTMNYVCVILALILPIIIIVSIINNHRWFIVMSISEQIANPYHAHQCICSKACIISQLVVPGFSSKDLVLNILASPQSQ